MQPSEVQEAYLDSLTELELRNLPYNWEFWGRPDQQIPPGNWRNWLILCGRGWGKTRTLSETVLEWKRQGFRYVNLAGRTTGSLREAVIDGESGIIAKASPDLRPKYISNKAVLRWPDGSESLCFSAEEGEKARGPQSEKLAIDELGAWPEIPEDQKDKSLWHNLQLGLRIGSKPQCVIATTGRRKAILRALLKDKRTFLTRGHTMDNRANLDAGFIEKMMDDYDGTSLGAQELGGDVLDDVEGAFWTEEQLKDQRIDKIPCAIVRTVIGVDPAVTSNKRSDAIGIVVVGLGENGNLYVLADLSDKLGPDDWVSRVLWAYRHFHADLIVAESNKGGELIEHALRAAADKDGWIPNVRTEYSTDDKSIRAEPVSVFYQRNRVFHVGATEDDLKLLEGEMTTWDPRTTGGKSPNRIDALVFACTELAPNVGPGHFGGKRVEAKPDTLKPDRKRSSILIPRRGGGLWQTLCDLGLAA